VLQIDSPDLGIERAGYFQDEPLPRFIEAMEMHVSALNEAPAGIPTERVRFHACWGNRDSPHVNDVPAPDVLPVCNQVKAGALCLPFANPRHSHEVDALRTQKLPDRMSLVCGVVETTHNYVEHPQVIAASAPSSATPRCPRTWCGPSSRRCATARQSPASGCGVEEAIAW
jgi:5-methyltetrahydropteroyltriglutamate--homocysteine methyltransferase